jgi:transposase
VSWLRSHGELALVGVEGTGSYGVGVSRYLQREGVTVVEVDRPNRQTRHRKGKSDPVDAVAAARAALPGTATGSPKARDGTVEAIRVLMIARRSAVDTRIETLNQLRHVVFTATPEIRAKFTGLSAITLANKASALRPREGDDPVRYTTLVTIRALGHRVQYLREETKRLNRMLRPLIRQTTPTLLEVYGVGYDTAAKLLVAAGDNPERIETKELGPTSAEPHPSPLRRGRRNDIVSTEEATGKPTRRCITSSSPGCDTTSQPATTWQATLRRQDHGRDRPDPETPRRQRSVQTPPDPHNPLGRGLARSNRLTPTRVVQRMTCRPRPRSHNRTRAARCDLLRACPHNTWVAHPCRVHQTPTPGTRPAQRQAWFSASKSTGSRNPLTSIRASIPDASVSHPGWGHQGHE